MMPIYAVLPKTTAVGKFGESPIIFRLDLFKPHGIFAVCKHKKLDAQTCVQLTLERRGTGMALPWWK